MIMVKCTVSIREQRPMTNGDPVFAHPKIFRYQVCEVDTYQYGTGNYKITVLEEGVSTPYGT